ncbi:MAG TPA: substrate-binding domain-containing protein [Hyphomicrobiaceae bacterium]|nr:substrate-binding domain-containing protein [Hyphomicrobiaceae bacterium]
MRLIILSGGAAQGLVKALAPQFKAESGCEIEGTFGAVGAMRDKLLAGAPADLLILTRRLIDELVGQGHAVPASAIDIGTVVTAVAVRTGDSAPAVGDPEALRAALVAADEIYIPDPKLATAGIHIARALETLGITEQVAPRLRTFPNGATAMRALALARSARPIGCTQATEIVATPGVTLVAPLPEPIDLATIYTAAVSMRAALPDEACALASLLTGDAASAARRQAGFDQAPPLPA